MSRNMCKHKFRFFWNKRGFSMEFSLQRISSISLLWKWNDSSIVLWLCSWHGKPAASARACLREANKERLKKNCYERICKMFLISKCRGDWDLGQCTFWVLAKREPLRSGDFRKKRVSPAGKIGIWPWPCSKSLPSYTAILGSSSYNETSTRL